jgi:glycosyltransferase involved in cell wall biosynthesis
VIVDDGSTDGTKELSQAFSEREETFFPLRYFYQENGGKHRSMHHGVWKAQGELF